MLPPPLPLHFAFVSHLSLFPLLSCRCHYSVLHPGEILGAFCWMCIACATRFMLLRFPKGLERAIVATVSADQRRRNRRWAFIWLRSEIRSLGLARLGSAFWLMSPVWSKTSPVCYPLLRLVTQRSVQFAAWDRNMVKPRE